jgi:LSD1 subclass zinc finger protein
VYKVHRRLSERLVYASAHECRDCAARIRRFRLLISCIRFVFTARTACPSCGVDWVSPASKPPVQFADVSRDPLSFIQQLRGAPRFKCSLCTTHYYDARSLRRDQEIRTTELAANKLGKA